MDNNAAREALLPCPWCNGPADFNWYENIGRNKRWYCYCQPENELVGCVKQDGGYARKKDAIAAWNTRAALASNQPVAVDVGEVSDGYHTFNELYEHRYALFAVVCRSHPSWKSRAHDDGSMLEGQFIAGVETPDGQATYHLPLRLWEGFPAKEIDSAPAWDGHTSNDVIQRLLALTQAKGE